MAEPSMPMPSSKADSSSAGATDTLFSVPSTSVNQSRTKRMSRSSSVRSTNSCCRSTTTPRAGLLAGQCPPAPLRRDYADHGAGRRFGWGTMDHMPTLRIALAQVNSTVGDIAGNAASVRRWSRAAADAGAQLVAFPEMMLTGYPIEDLVFRDSFVHASQRGLRTLAADLAADGLGDLAVIVGYVDADGPAPTSAAAVPGSGRRDASALLLGGEVAATYFKHHLPNYGVFDEDRYFEPGETLTVVRYGGVDIALTVCEDLWQAGGPFAAACRAGVGLVVNINASPYELNKDDVRLPLVRRRAAEAGATVAYVNLIGGQDELVFDGDSMIVTADGDLLTRAGQFTEQLLVHDLELPDANEAPNDPGTGPELVGRSDESPGGETSADGDMAIVRIDLPRAPRPIGAGHAD